MRTWRRVPVLELAVEHAERAVYVVEGAVEIGDGALSVGQMAVLAPVPTAARAVGRTQLMILGGGRFATPRHLYWNFVASSPERIERAKLRWKNREFPARSG